MSKVFEQPLPGGQTHGVVRVGSTVRRPAHPRSGFVQALLRHLEAVGFDGAPRALGYDEQGRPVLSYVDGMVPQTAPYALSDAQLVSGATLVCAYHDATASSPLRDGHEVVCHGDLGPHNTVFRGEVAVAIIDWDGDVQPGRRAVDFAHAVWCFADLIEPDVPLAEQARRTRLMCDAYPGMTPQIVLSELTARFERARAQHEAARRSRAVEIFDGLLAWLDAHGQDIATAPAECH
jgi:aminoglycoside phosphotransferase (APT) family kinase protein